MAKPPLPATQTLSTMGQDLPLTQDAEFPLHLSGELHPSTEPLPPRQPAPGVMIARPQVPGYEILRELGRGGMGVVFLARQTALNRLVALKMVLDGAFASPEDRQRFLREAELIARLHHPSIVQVFEFGTLEEHPYFSLEYVSGGTLAERLQGRPQDPRTSAALLGQLADAVQHAHSLGIVHRDLKPANVLLLLKNEESQVKKESPISPNVGPLPLSLFLPKITDFGLAKQVQAEPGITTSGTLLGTPNYMAPEQARGTGAVIGPATDVYALGAILYELLTGRPPFQGLSPMETAMQVIVQEPVSPRRLLPTVPRDLETISLKCLQKDPHRRYESAAALAADLRRYLDGQPIQARPIGPLERLGKWARRKPGVAGLTAALVFLAAASIAGLSWLYWDAHTQRHQALAAREEARAAEARAKEAETRARLAAAQADVLNRFFIDHFLAQIQPEQARNRTITFEEVLSRAAARIAQVFAGQPELELQIRALMGKAYTDLGRHQDALFHLERVTLLSLELYGPQHHRTLVARTNLASVRNQVQQTPEDLQEVRDLLAQRLKELGPDHSETLTLQNNLAQLLRRQDQAAEAEKIYREILRRGEKALGPHHPLTLSVQVNLGYHLYTQGRAAEAEPLLRTGLAGLTQLLGEEHPKTITSRNNHALALQALGRHTEAERLFRETWSARVRILGPEHPDTLTAQHNIAGSLHVQGQFAQAEKLYREVLEARRRIAGPHHPDTLGTLDNLSQAVFRQRKHIEAIPLLQELYDQYRQLHGTTHAQTQRTLANLASEMGNAQRFVEAEPLFALLYAHRQEQLGPEHAETLNALFFQGYCRLQAKALSQAEPLLQQCVAGRRRTLGPTHADTQTAVFQLARCLASQRRVAEGEKLLLETYTALEKDPKVPPTQRKDLAEKILQFYKQTNQPDAADKWRQKLEGLSGT